MDHFLQNRIQLDVISQIISEVVVDALLGPPNGHSQLIIMMTTIRTTRVDIVGTQFSLCLSTCIRDCGRHASSTYWQQIMLRFLKFRASKQQHLDEIVRSLFGGPPFRAVVW